MALPPSEAAAPDPKDLDLKLTAALVRLDTLCSAFDTLRDCVHATAQGAHASTAVLKDLAQTLDDKRRLKKEKKEKKHSKNENLMEDPWPPPLVQWVPNESLVVQHCRLAQLKREDLNYQVGTIDGCVDRAAGRWGVVLHGRTQPISVPACKIFEYAVNTHDVCTQCGQAISLVSFPPCGCGASASDFDDTSCNDSRVALAKRGAACLPRCPAAPLTAGD